MKTTPRRKLATITALSVLVLIATGCAGDAGNGGESSGSTDFVYLSDGDSACFDTYQYKTLSTYNVVRQIQDPLVAQDTDGTYYGGLAESWESSEDGMVWTFHLREDVVFHDGEPLTAEAVKLSIERSLEEGSTLDKPVWFGSSRVVDDLTWELTLSQPYPAILQILSTPDFPILSPVALETYTDGDFCADPTALVGTGPFKVESYTPGSEMVLVRNEDYDWAPEFREHEGPAYLETVTIKFVSESAARIGQFTSGQADAAAGISPLMVEQVSGDGMTTISAAATGVPFTVLLNVEGGATSDLNVRKALQVGVDIDTIVESVYGGEYDRAYSPLAPGTPPAGSYAETLEGALEYDADQAIAYLEAAGYTTVDSEGYRTKDGERLTLRWIVEGDDIRDQRDVVIQQMQAGYAEIGVEAVIENLDSNAYNARTGEGSYELLAGSWGRAEGDILTSLFNQNALPPAGIAFSRFQSDELRSLMSATRATNDADERAALFQDVQEQVTLDLALNIPIYVQKFIVAQTEDVEGISFDIVGYPGSFYDVRFTD